MKSKRIVASFVLVAIILSFLSFEFFYQQPSILIPRRVLFDNPNKISVQLSPSGEYISYLAPSKKGILNVWVEDITRKKPTMITHETERNIHGYTWSENNAQILYEKDNAGNENWHLYKTDIKSQQTEDLTPYKNVSVRQLMLNKDYPNQILLGLNLRNPKLVDMYRIDLSTGRKKLEAKNPGNISSWYADTHLQIRAAITQSSQDGSSALFTRKDKKSEWHQILQWPFGDGGSIISFSEDGQSLIIVNTLNADTSRLMQINADTGKKEKVIAENAFSDIDNIMINPNTYQVEAVAFNYLKPTWILIDKSLTKDFEILNQVIPGAMFNVTSRDRKDNLWIVVYHKDNMGPIYYLYNRQKAKVTKLFSVIPALTRYHLAEMTPVIITARDGVQLVAYLTRPNSYRTQKFPMILLVHGGPWTRDNWGFNPQVQWLANRGYAVLQVNYRGSSGFGKKFLNSGNGEWGVGKMQQDLTDAVHWAIQHNIADPDRIGIMGGSYGGYATLAGLTFTPELYACGIDIVGPSDLKTLMETIPPYWEIARKEMLLRIGDVEHNDKLNQKLSPLYHIKNIRAPLMIAQGANDPRVKMIHSDKIVAEMKKKHIPVTYLVYENEGHGFVQPNNRLDFYGRAEQFLAKHLGGAREAWQFMPGTKVKVQ